ncbi:MAG: GNAT family N-acetyltransferase [Deltaproteobacteria bacterium]|nr:GNAT family N-acetyltransferase [Deltaproteobacteria bacterium]
MAHTIRRATERDLPFIAWVQQEASRSHLPFGFWDLAIPGSDAYRLGIVARIANRQPESFAHWSRFLVAEVDGEPAAALSAYDDAKVATGERFFRALVEAMTAEGWNEARLGAMQQRVAPFLACAPDQPDDTWIVEWVATRPAHRGKGLTKALLHAILDAGRTRGHTRFQIGVLIGNTPAQRAYEGAGFAVFDEKRDPAFEATFGAPGIRQLRRGG